MTNTFLSKLRNTRTGKLEQKTSHVQGIIAKKHNNTCYSKMLSLLCTFIGAWEFPRSVLMLQSLLYVTIAINCLILLNLYC